MSLQYFFGIARCLFGKTLDSSAARDLGWCVGKGFKGAANVHF